MRSFSASALSAAEAYALLVGIVVPRPVAWITTVDASGTNHALTFIETPFPPPALRSGIPGPYGVSFDFGSDTQLGIDFSGAGPFTYSFGWRLPSCSIEVVQQAAVEQEKAECSNRGLCNRLNGQCECFHGYAGFSCSQQTVYV